MTVEEVWRRLNELTENTTMVHALLNGWACVHPTSTPDWEVRAPTLEGALRRALREVIDGRADPLSHL